MAGTRNTIGGWPILEVDQPWPSCDCGERMVFYFQVDIPPEVATFGGDHVMVFQCPVHNEACFPPDSEQLPVRFWDHPPAPNKEVFWRILLHRTGTPAADPDPYLQPRRLTLRQTSDEVDEFGRGVPVFKVSGVPSWAQKPEHYRCPCGADLAFVCQIPENFGFDIIPGQPEQPDTFDSTQYGLFLGNEVYILACSAHCDPAAAWPVNQN